MRFVNNIITNMNNISQIFTLTIRQNAIRRRDIYMKLALKNKFHFTNSMLDTIW